MFVFVQHVESWICCWIIWRPNRLLNFILFPFSPAEPVSHPEHGAVDQESKSAGVSVRP